MPVLKVKIDGQWVNVSGGSGASSGSAQDYFIVEIDVDNETASHTPSEITAAVAAGKVVVARCASSLLFNGTIFNLYNVSETSAVFEYTRSNLADVDTYRYTIDENKTATLTTFSLDIGSPADLATDTKSSLVAAINEVAANAGGSGTSETPVFDLVSMGLPTITLDGVAVSCACDTTELRSALRAGIVKVKVNVTNGTDVTEAEALVMQSMSVSDTIHQTITRAEIYQKFYDFQMYVRESGIEVTAMAVEEGSGSTAEIPDNVVTCDLEGATEDETTVSVNADTLGGNAPEYYAKASSITRRISESIKNEELKSYVKAVRDGNIVSYHVSLNWYDTGSTFSMSGFQFTDIAQLSKEYWPYASMHCIPGVDASGASVQPNIRIAITTDGVVSVRNYNSSTVSNIQGIYGTFAFAARYTIEELEEVTA